jgi:two-component system chemotaxis sensor kinase CheA
MTLDLAQFHDAFFQEGFEALDSMEAALLNLSSGVADAETINTIFRVAHSIKGGSATFGFMEIASFTHTAETLLDKLRGNQMEVTPQIVDLLLKSVDVMRAMLAATQAKTPVDAASVGALQRDLEKVIASGGGPAAAHQSASSGATAPAAPTANAAPTAGAQSWRVKFTPKEALLRNGNDPLRMIRELAALAPVTVRVDAAKLPPLADLDPEVCRLKWEIEVPAALTREQIVQVFDWAEADCELLIEAPVTPIAAAAATPQPAESASAASPAAPSGAATAAKGGDASSIRVSIEKVDELMNTVGELVITQSMLSQLTVQMDGAAADELRSGLGMLERQMRALQESVMRVRMLPINFVFNRFPRMVRDISQKLGKKVELKMTGADTEVDKTVLEKIGDPLVHLVRNSIDHGLEMPEARLAAGKSEHGTIHLNAYHKGGNITVEVSDDGAGLNRERILKKARERGLVSADEELSDDRIHNLNFAAGFSTAEQVTDLSGRGVGMDVVRRNINELGGQVQVFSTPGQGSTVRIRLPLTLAILDGQLVRVGNEIYVIPLVSIVETIQVERERVNTIAGRSELFRLREEYVPIIRLYDLFGVEPDSTDLLEGLLMIVEADGRRVGIFVDDLLAQQQVVIKSLETNFRQVPGLAGATMLGDGRVALIVDVPGLITSFDAVSPREAPPKQAVAA